MTWWMLRRTRVNVADIEEARRERKRAEHSIQEGKERWADVSRVVQESRRIRRVNHLADDLRTIFGG